MRFGTGGELKVDGVMPMPSHSDFLLPSPIKKSVVDGPNQDSGAGLSMLEDTTPLDSNSEGSQEAIPSAQRDPSPVVAAKKDLVENRRKIKLPYGCLDGAEGLLVTFGSEYMFDLSNPNEVEEYLSHSEANNVTRSEVRMFIHNLKQNHNAGLI